MRESGLSLLLAAAFLSCSQNGKLVYKDATASVEDRVEDLLSRMTLEEKVGQVLCPLGWQMYEKTSEGVSISPLFRERMGTTPLGNLWGVLRADPWTEKTLKTGLSAAEGARVMNMLQKYAVDSTRLGIPLLFAEECAHGHMAIGATVFPTGIMQASTFDEDVLEQMGEAVGLETRIQGGHMAYGPVVDIARDPRWSRMEETFGEDPYLTGRLSSAVVKGMAGDSIQDGQHVFPVLKHFAAYGIPEGGINGEMASIGRRALLSEYIPQFRSAVKAGAGGIMASYNSVDGVPCVANSYLLSDVLRGEWGFDGVVYSDLQAIEGLVGTHRVAKDKDEAARLSLEAGVDIDLEGHSFERITDLVRSGKVDEKDLDMAVRNVLRKKFQLGLFEKPYVDESKARSLVGSLGHRRLAREIARKGIVLLKNNGILPLSRNVRRIAVIGPNADNMYNQLGDYTAPQEDDAIWTVLEGIREKVPDAKICYEKGCAIRDKGQTDISKAVAAAKASDVTILVVGGSSARDFRTEYLPTGAADAEADCIQVSDMECGEGYDRASLDLMGDQQMLMERLFDSGVRVVVAYIEGRPLNMNVASERADALLLAWYPGCEGGRALADVIFGDYNPAGRLPVSVPRSAGQLPVYYSAHKSHDYVDMPSMPLYSFGYGLSYATFRYGNLKIQDGDGKSAVKTVSCTVKNDGDRDGEEVVQLYIDDMASSVVVPHKLLKGFRRVYLKKGETRKVEFNLGFDELSLVDSNMARKVEPGEFKVMIGASSDDIRLEGSFEIQ